MAVRRATVLQNKEQSLLFVASLPPLMRSVASPVALVVAAVLVLLADPCALSASNSTDFIVSAYLPEWRYSGVDWSLVTQGVSHLILFSVEILPSGSIGALDRIPSPHNLQQARSAAERNGCRIMLCVGGNGRSAGFPVIVARQELRARFVKELVALLDKLQLHGVDYNWCAAFTVIPHVIRDT